MKRLALILFLCLSFLFSMALATNIFAALLHHARILGYPQLGPYYEPFHILYWFATIRVAGTEYWIAFIVFSASFALLGFLAFNVYTATGLNLRGIYGHARWATLAELRRDGLFHQNSGAVILGQTKNAAFRRINPTLRAIFHTPGIPPARRILALSRVLTRGTSAHTTTNALRYHMLRPGRILYNSDDKHILVSAPTRSGKGVSVIIPTLFAWLGSAVVYDIKKENFAITSGWRRGFSHVLCFEPASKDSVRFNPLDEIPNDDTAIAAVQNLCQTLTNPNGETDHDHWRATAAQLLLGVILYVLYNAGPTRRSLAGVYNLLNDPTKPLKSTNPLQPSTLDDMLHNTHPSLDCREAIAQTARNLLTKPPNEFGSIVSTASTMLSLYQDPIVAANTASSDFRIRDLVDSAHPATLYICVAPADAARIRPLVRVLLEQIVNTLTTRLIAHKHRLLLLIDEFPQLGRLAAFESQLAFIAGYGIKALLVVQSLGQLFRHYGEHTSILDNCHYKLILGVGGSHDARYVAEALGTYSVNKKTVSHSGSIGSITAASRSTSETETQAQLMTPDDIARLPETDFLLLRKGDYAYHGRKIFYYLDKRFAGRSGMPTITVYADQLKELPGYVPPIELPPSETPKQLTAPEPSIVQPLTSRRAPTFEIVPASETLAPSAASPLSPEPPLSPAPLQATTPIASENIEDIIDV